LGKRYELNGYQENCEGGENMKILRFLFVLSVIFVLNSFVVSDVRAANLWPRGSRTLCWVMTASDMSGFLKLRITSAGGGNYILSGTVIVDDKLHDIVNGSSVLSGNNVLIAVKGSWNDSESMWTATTNIVLDKTTLNGTYDWLSQDFNYSDLSINTQHKTGSLTHILCPLI
jgi:hypothetical protein